MSSRGLDGPAEGTRRTKGRELDTAVSGLSRQIRELRERQGLSLQKLAVSCGVARSQIWKIERDARRASLATLVKIGRALGAQLYFGNPAMATLQETGIVGWFKDQDDVGSQIREDMERARDIRIVLVRGRTVVAKRDSLLRGILEAKGKEARVRLLVLNPMSPHVGQIEQQADLPTGSLSADIRETLKALGEIEKTSAAGRFVCRVYDRPPTFRLMFADDVVYVGSYLPRFFSTGAALAAYRIVKKDPPLESLFLGFEAHFDDLWKVGALASGVADPGLSALGKESRDVPKRPSTRRTIRRGSGGIAGSGHS